MEITAFHQVFQAACRLEWQQLDILQTAAHVRRQGGHGWPSPTNTNSISGHGLHSVLTYGANSGTISPMSSAKKILEQLRREPTNVRFADLREACEAFFGEPHQNGTSHLIFKMPWQGDPRVNIQDAGGKAKPYQVRYGIAGVMHRLAACGAVAARECASGGGRDRADAGHRSGGVLHAPHLPRSSAALASARRDHSDTELDFSTAYRHHVLEVLLTALATLPVLMVLGPDVSVLVAYQLLSALVVALSHAEYLLRPVHPGVEEPYP